MKTPQQQLETINALIRRTQSRVRALEKDLQGDSACCALAGSGFVLTDVPEPARDARRQGSLDVPSYLRSGKPVDIVTFGITTS